ncbi:hypothetical protein llap_6167 [Limosa lapponica baueri]|uniref:Uncharacterized protein n=1 Tax=Limosa lapponica baueri TaxID=1758121 RepID=A0A2I0UBU3_LIMLA|nr:hypothetical protein llap_6167 [Limosa lapponica baueri]
MPGEHLLVWRTSTNGKFTPLLEVQSLDPFAIFSNEVAHGELPGLHGASYSCIQEYKKWGDTQLPFDLIVLSFTIDNLADDSGHLG